MISCNSYKIIIIIKSIFSSHKLEINVITDLSILHFIILLPMPMSKSLKHITKDFFGKLLVQNIRVNHGIHFILIDSILL